MAVRISLTPPFNKSLARLTRQEQDQVNRSVIQFLQAPDAAGARLHALDTREKRFHSISVGMDLRIIVLRDGPHFALMHVDHHDRAYRWAERRRVETHEVTGSAQIVEFEEVVREEIVTVRRAVAAPPLFAGESDPYLLSLGVPRVYLPAVRAVTDDDGLIALVDRLPEEAWEALTALANGERPAPARVAAPSESPFETEDARRRFWVATEEAVLRRALERPWDEWLVFLHPSQRDAVERNFNGPARVSGSAGTGKSVVAMHRAARLAEASGGGRVLLTTYSPALAARLARGMDALLGADSPARGRVAVSTLFDQAERLLRAAGRAFTPADPARIAGMLEAHRGGVDPAAHSPAFLLNEWRAVIDHQGVRDWTTYRDLRRMGRGAPLSPRRRQEIWPVFEATRAAMDAAGLMTEGDVCGAAHDLLCGAGGAPFRHLVVDEAQDLGPRELAFASVLAAQGPRAQFYVGDAGQQIQRYPFSWTSVGVHVRGRSRRLRVNYRTSEQIRRFADRLLPAAIEELGGDEESRAAVSVLRGPAPEVIACADDAGQGEALRRWIAAARARGVAPAEIAVLARSDALAQALAAGALAALALGAAPLADPAPPEGAAYLGALADAKGLEFRCVALIGADAGRLPLAQALAAEESEEGRSLAAARERHLLYVGCTRARESLALIHGAAPSPFLAET